MFLIDCPWCGTRDQREFCCGGEDLGPRPIRPEDTDDDAWAGYVFMRTNAKGVSDELWHHQHGCRRWFRVSRDTATDRILAVRPIVKAPQGTDEEAAANDREPVFEARDG